MSKSIIVKPCLLTVVKMDDHRDYDFWIVELTISNILYELICKRYTSIVVVSLFIVHGQHTITRHFYSISCDLNHFFTRIKFKEKRNE